MKPEFWAQLQAGGGALRCWHATDGGSACPGTSLLTLTTATWRGVAESTASCCGACLAPWPYLLLFLQLLLLGI